MIQRNSTEARFQGGGDIAIQGSSRGLIGPNVDKFRENQVREDIDTSSDNSAMRVLDKLMNAGGKLVDQKIEQSQAEAYLDGAAKAGTGMAEDELDSDPFTRAWTTQGYRDTMGRVAQAEIEAKILADMPRMREATPEKYNEYLSGIRKELLPALEGMSLKQRSSAMQNILLNERAAIRRHTTEHAKFIVEAEDRSISAMSAANVAALNSARGDAGVYIPQTDKAFAALTGNVIANPKLPTKVQQNILGNSLSYALANDHLRLYEMAQSEPVTLPDGTTGTVMSMLDWDDKVKLSNQYRESMNRTKTIRGLEYGQRRARLEASFADPTAELPNEEQFNAFVTEGANTGFLENPEPMQEAYYKAVAKRAVVGVTGAAWASGDSGKLTALGKTDAEGLEAWMGTHGRHLSPKALTEQLMSIGIQGGRPAALDQLGKQLQPALAQIGMTDTVDPANAEAIATVVRTLDRAEREGRGAVFSTVMQSLPEDQQAKLSYVREGIRAGLPPTLAYSQAASRIAEESKLTPQERAALAGAQAKDNVALIEEMTPRSFYDSVILKAKSMFSKDAAALHSATPRSHWFENPERLAEAGASAKFAALEELRALGQAHPMMGADARKSVALANVQARTVVTEGGPFVLPRGSTVQQFFGVPASVGHERVGAALNEFVKPQTDDGRIVYRVTEGQLTYSELNTKGQLVRSGRLNPKEVAGMVQAQQDREVQEQRILNGRGVEKNGVTINGENTAGLEPKLVFGLRSHLLDTAAVKLNATNPSMKGAVAEAFKRESDKAAQYARLPMVTTGKGGQNALNLFGELAIRTDYRFNSDKAYRPLLSAMKQNDVPAAAQALMDTPHYKEAPAAHQARLLEALNQAMKGL